MTKTLEEVDLDNSGIFAIRNHVLLIQGLVSPFVFGPTSVL